MKLKPLHHSVLDRLAPDQWGESLMCFRAIPELKMFSPEGADEALKRLEPEDRQLVEECQNSPDKLIKKCRNFESFDSLRGLGVFEVCFSKPPTGEPTTEQIAGYQYFQEHQIHICANIANAMLRYYPVARSIDEDWFDNNDCPAVNSLDDLGPLTTLDGITYTNTVCEGLSVLMISWRPGWDEEHGLSMAVWKDQVIGIGIEDLHDLSPPSGADYLTWNRSHMTPAECDALDRVVSCLCEWEDDDEEDYGKDDFDNYDNDDDE